MKRAIRTSAGDSAPTEWSWDYVLKGYIPSAGGTGSAVNHG
jgi:hypothetical protein